MSLVYVAASGQVDRSCTHSTGVSAELRHQNASTAMAMAHTLAVCLSFAGSCRLWVKRWQPGSCCGVQAAPWHAVHMHFMNPNAVKYYKTSE